MKLPRPRIRALCAPVVAFAAGLVGGPAAAEVSVSIHFDEAGDGGAEISSVLNAAATAWEECMRQLPGALDVGVAASFVELPCGASKKVVARAHTGHWSTSEGLLIPPSLAAYKTHGAVLVEEGLGIDLNSALLAPGSCEGAEWSTVIPAPGAPQLADGPELFAAIQHELGHILGLDVGYDVLASAETPPSVYLTQLASRMHGVSLNQLGHDDLRIAITTPLNVVWTGPATRALAAVMLEPGVPEMYTKSLGVNREGSGELLGVGARLISRGSGGGRPLEGRLTLVEDACGAQQSREGQIAVLVEPSCGLLAALTNLTRDGVVAVVVEGVDVNLVDVPSAEIPVVALGDEHLSEAMRQGEPVDVLLRVNDARLRGADPSGNVYVHTPSDYDPAVSLVHLDPATVPSTKPLYPTSNVPQLGYGLDPTCGFALSMLLDLGYARPGCGDGVPAPDEACDDGGRNSNVVPNACRHSCEEPHCGDGVVDDGEGCDDGVLNSNGSDACRVGCISPRCGDGIVDLAHGERCDDGVGNSDEGRATCRLSCLPGTCGDALLDEGEECDEGARNSSEVADRCRLDCVWPRCGDGVVDAEHGETCDDGNTVADPWCSADCHERKSAGDVHDAAPTDAGRAASDAGARSQVVPDASEAGRLVEPDAATERSSATSHGCECALNAPRLASSRARWGSAAVAVLLLAMRLGARRRS